MLIECIFALIMKMTNRYFTPKIEDIRVGYECEWKLDKVDSSKWGDESVYNWQKHTITQNDFNGGEMADDWHNFGNPTCTFRTPYLTKEDLEAEGWVSQLAYKRDSYKFVGNNSKDYRIEVNWEHFVTFDPSILPSITVLISLLGTHYFIGRIKSINEFRTMIKMLNR